MCNHAYSLPAQTVTDIDVLAKNSFGVCPLTDAFQAKDPAILKVHQF